MRNSGLVAIITGVAFIIACWLLANAFKARYTQNDTIQVVGLGKADFDADLIVWRANFSRKSMELSAAYDQLDKDRKLIEDFFSKAGIPKEEIVFLPVNLNRDFEYRYKDGYNQNIFSGYTLTQEVKIESFDVEKVEKLSTNITEVIQNGVELYSFRPQYLYTKLADLKLQMIGEATKDATNRAKIIAEQANSSLGDLKNARMGVFQIIARNSSEEYTWGGAFNTMDEKKTATITMRLEFGIK